MTMMGSANMGVMNDRTLSGIIADLSRLRLCRSVDHAGRRLPVVLSMPELQDRAETKIWRLLRVLFLRQRALSADSSGARNGQERVL